MTDPLNDEIATVERLRKRASQNEEAGSVEVVAAFYDLAKRLAQAGRSDDARVALQEAADALHGFRDSGSR
ncbi:hypothetical protein AB0N23_35355, partial [Streptomyces sp. NPDC052644]